MKKLENMVYVHDIILDLKHSIIYQVHEVTSQVECHLLFNKFENVMWSLQSQFLWFEEPVFVPQRLQYCSVDITWSHPSSPIIVIYLCVKMVTGFGRKFIQRRFLKGKMFISNKVGLKLKMKCNQYIIIINPLYC